MTRPVIIFAGIVLSFIVSTGYGASLLVPTDYPTIQDALDAALDGDEVVVEPGTYQEILTVPPRAITLRSQSGNPANTILDGSLVPDNVALVLFDGDPAGTRALRGFTLTNSKGPVRIDGFANTGLHIIEDCRFINMGPNGALRAVGASTDILNNEFIDNEGIFGGGAIVMTGAGLIQNNLFQGNDAIPSGTLTLTQGGAIYLLSQGGREGSFVEIRNNTFEENTCTDYGGAIQITQNFNCNVIRNKFKRNFAAICAGAIYVVANSRSVLLRGNTLIENESSQGAGFGIDICQGTRIIANTIVGSIRGAGIRLEGSFGVIVQRNIVAFGTGEGIKWANSGATQTCNNSFGNVLRNYAGGAVNFSFDPLFCNALGENYTLRANSPCLPALNSCNLLIGAFDTRCGAVATTDATWGRAKSLYAE
ncbi:MAG: right-handed parallel beta-helix repeat-containing protein [bacterium]|nr:right-handed parallel beta-helix repeat-containing protein [bacterium]